MSDYTQTQRDQAQKIIVPYIQDIADEIKVHDLRSRLNNGPRMKLERISLAKDMAARIIKEQEISDPVILDLIKASIALMYKVIKIRGVNI